MANNEKPDSKGAPEADNIAEGEGGLKLGEALKKVVSVGIGAAFMTEEHIRNYLGDMKIPKDVLTNLLQTASNSKEDLMDRVGAEVGKIFSKIDFVKEASKFAEEHKFKVQAEIEIIKKNKPTD